MRATACILHHVAIIVGETHIRIRVGATIVQIHVPNPCIRTVRPIAETDRASNVLPSGSILNFPHGVDPSTNHTAYFVYHFSERHVTMNSFFVFSPIVVAEIA